MHQNVHKAPQRTCRTQKHQKFIYLEALHIDGWNQIGSIFTSTSDGILLLKVLFEVDSEKVAIRDHFKNWNLFVNIQELFFKAKT